MISSETVTRALALIEQDQSKILDITVGKHGITPPGFLVPKEDAQSTPEAAYTAALASKTYLAISVDLDAPFQMFSFLSPLLHWIQPGLKPTSSFALQPSELCIANWGPPNPPGPSGPHRYLFLLYEQPSDFNAEELMWPEGQTLKLGSRVRFDLDAWEKKANLAPAIAANYFNSH